MTLVVAAIHDGVVTLVADTKLTYEQDAARTRHVFAEALPKLVILRSDLVVGVAGEDPHGVVRRLIEARDESVEQVLGLAAGMPDASFVVAALDPARLWMVINGETSERTGIARAWAGDISAFEFFQQKFHEWPGGVDTPFRLLSSMQWLTSFGVVPSVGGYSLRVAAHHDGFRFVADFTWVGPWLLESALEPSAEGLTLRASVPPDGDETTHQLLVVPGDEPTRGALGLLLPEAGVGLLFPHEQPWRAERITVSSAGDFVRAALVDHRQQLARTQG